MAQPEPFVMLRTPTGSPSNMFRSSQSQASNSSSYEYTLDHHPPTPMTACCPQPSGDFSTDNDLDSSERFGTTASERSNGSAQDTAVAVASALVGETVCDSPTNMKQTRSVSSSESLGNAAPFPTGVENEGGPLTDSTFLGSVRSHKPQAPRAPRAKYIRSDSTNSEDSDHIGSVSSRDLLRRSSSGDSLGSAGASGMVASGLAWVQRQRERRRRQNLKAQAEQQIRKIVQAVGAPPQTDGLNSTTTSLSFDAMPSRSLEADESKNSKDAAQATAVLSKSGEGAVGKLDMFTGNQEDDAMQWTPEVRVEPEKRRKGDDDEDQDGAEEDDPNFILTPKQMQEVAAYVLPLTMSSCRWKRIYGLTRDGDSFEACMRNVEGHMRTLLVIRTTRGAIFGAYADAPWRTNEAGNFYGSAQACLYTFSDALGRSSMAGRQVQVYKWTGANRYIQLCDSSSRMLAFGGGGDVGAFGLCVEDDFQKGSTGPCDTFGNDPLCDQEHFDIVDVEIWGFLSVF